MWIHSSPRAVVSSPRSRAELLQLKINPPLQQPNSPDADVLNWVCPHLPPPRRVCIPKAHPGPALQVLPALLGNNRFLYFCKGCQTKRGSPAASLALHHFRASSCKQSHTHRLPWTLYEATSPRGASAQHLPLGRAAPRGCCCWCLMILTPKSLNKL